MQHSHSYTASLRKTEASDLESLSEHSSNNRWAGSENHHSAEGMSATMR